MSLNARLFIVFSVFLVAVIGTVPNVLDTEKNWWPTKAKMVLGLDIQGGSHLVYRVDVESAIKQDITRLATTLKSELEKEKVELQSSAATDVVRGEINLVLKNSTDKAAVEAYLNKNYSAMLRIDQATNEKVVVSYQDIHVREFKKRLVEQAITTIRNRIDEFGVAEPSISAQGSDRILVQLPGIKDSTSAKDLINRTARLDFMMVQMDFDQQKLTELIATAEKTADLKFAEMKYSTYVEKLNLALKGKIPENTAVLFEKDEGAKDMNSGRRPWLLSTVDAVAGDRLTDAYVSMGQHGDPDVSFSFDAVGARQFADLTTKFTGKLMAIVLDKVVKSAPRINGPIPSGHGVITLGGSRDYQAAMNEAKIISTALRAGALPATLEQLEERTVGPSLGADAIEKGKFASIVSAIAVFAFMILYYRSFGFVADIALMFNILIVLAVLSALGASLTLPGVAGLALTLGISVDANVIIYERIKEEMNKGASLISAIKEGYDKAFSSIFDANVTSVAVCIVLMYFGTGPVRGFAVTLLTGLLITMFTAVFFTRAVFDLFVVKWKVPLKISWSK